MKTFFKSLSLIFFISLILLACPSYSRAEEKITTEIKDILIFDVPSRHVDHYSKSRRGYYYSPRNRTLEFQKIKVSIEDIKERILKGQPVHFIEDQEDEKKTIEAEWITNALKKEYGVKKIYINNAIITGTLRFHIFGNEVDIDESGMEKDEIKKQKDRGLDIVFLVFSSIKIINSQLQGDLNAEYFRNYFVMFKENVEFYNFTVAKSASFTRATFTKKAYFDGVTFAERCQFEEAIFTGNAYFNDTIFTRNVYFNDTTFTKTANFTKATFNELADFRRATFTEEAEVYFDEATFTASAKFSTAVFGERAYFNNVIFTKEANFNSATFAKTAYFKRAIFTEEANFSGATFTEEAEAYFVGANFSESAKFSTATFYNKVHFNKVTFTKEANFNRAIFTEIVDFSRTTFAERAEFIGTIFAEEAYFKRAKFSGLAYFLKAEIESLVLDLVIFEKIADFRDSLIKHLNFLNSSPNVIQGRIDFRNACILEAHFENLIFEKDVDFADVQFGNTNSDGAVIFRFVTFESEVYFIRTAFSGNIEFQRINFKKNVNFTNAVFEEEEEKIKHRFSLSYLNFTKLLISWNQLPNPDIWLRENDKDRIKSFVDIKKERDKILVGFSKEEFMLPFTVSSLCEAIKDDKYGLSQKSPNESIEWLNSILEISNFFDIVSKKKNFKDNHRVLDFVKKTNESRKKIYRDLNDKEKVTIKKLNRIIIEEAYPHETPKFREEVKLEPLYQVFQNLETTFRNQKKLGDANKAYYYKKQEMLKNTRSQGRLSLSRIGKEMEWFFLGLPCGYATKIYRICIVSGSSYLLFVLLFSIGGRLAKIKTEEKHEFAIRPRLFDFPSETTHIDIVENGNRFVNALVYSLFVFFKIGYQDRRISQKIFKINAKYFVWAEWIIGYWMLATITITIYNTVPTINRLISGIF